MVLYSTAVEELFTRGWLQGFLEPGRERSVLLPALPLSVPVLASALVFTAMHLTLVGKGVDPWSLVIILADYSPPWHASGRAVCCQRSGPTWQATWAVCSAGWSLRWFTARSTAACPHFDLPCRLSAHWAHSHQRG